MSTRQKIIEAMANIVLTQRSYTLDEMADAVIKVLEPPYSAKISRIDLPDMEIKGPTVPGDQTRLLALQERVERFMSSGEYYTLEQLAEAVGGLPTSVSARLRQAEQSGRWKKHKRLISAGLYEYRLIPVSSLTL